MNSREDIKSGQHNPSKSTKDINIHYLMILEERGYWMGKKLFIVAILVVLAVLAIYYFYPNLIQNQQKTPLPAYYTSLSESWKNANYDQDLFHEDLDSLLALSDTQLSAIKTNLQSRQNESTEPVPKQLAGVYVAYVELAQEIKKMNSLNDLISTSGDICENKTLFSSFANELQAANGKLTVFAEKTNAFVRDNQKEAEAIHLFLVGDSYKNKIIETANLRNEYLAALSICSESAVALEAHQ